MKKQVFLSVVFAFFAAFAGRWEQFKDNPVLGNEKLGTCFDVNVIEDGPAPYTMYFSWRPKKAIALVRSEDAFKWTQEPELCLVADPSCGWEHDLNRSCTVKKDGVYHMWYTGQAWSNQVKKTFSRIGYATSTDGVHFTRVSAKPVMVPEAEFEKESVMNPYVRWDAKRSVWRMWYAAGETYEPNVLCYAESKDGLKWEKFAGNPVFEHGDRLSWDRDRVGGCEVHPLGDGRWIMFYIGYYDVDTAMIGAAVSENGITGWKRLPSNPQVAPDLGEWNGNACYKPSLLKNVKKDLWMLFYNGRNGRDEYVGIATHRGMDLTAVADLPDATERMKRYVATFNRGDDELYTNAIPNAKALEFMEKNVPRFACPDKAVERTYYFRWWTFRKHLRHDLGLWTASEFLPKVGWSGEGNTIVCPAGHHFRECRWLRDPQYVNDLSRFWLSDRRSEKHRHKYTSWLFTGVKSAADITGNDALPAALLDDAIAYYSKWEKGWTGWYCTADDFEHAAKWYPSPMGGDGRGAFCSIDNFEGTEISLGGQGYKPLVNSAMWSEAKTIAEVAAKAGRGGIAAEYSAKAAATAKRFGELCWNAKSRFFYTTATNGVQTEVRELHGYAPWYFGMPSRGEPDFVQLTDPAGFYAKYGLSFPERRAPGFKIQYQGHECQWNGPSWPFATSIALTAYANHLHSSPSALSPSCPRAFPWLLSQYAMQHATWAPYPGKMKPWIDENFNPDKPDWISRTMIQKDEKMRAQFPKERGKDYNHSTFCDLVISGLVGFIPDGDRGFAVDPLFPATWDYCVLENLRYRGHDVDIVWHRGKGLSVSLDGRVVAKSTDLTRLSCPFSRNREM